MSFHWDPALDAFVKYSCIPKRAKKIPHLWKWDEEERIFAKMAPGPSMGWIRQRLRRLSIFSICTLCLRDIRIIHLFHRVEQLESYFKLLEVYPLISKKSRKIWGKIWYEEKLLSERYIWLQHRSDNSCWLNFHQSDPAKMASAHG